jgi:hypothetical protein
MKIVIGLAHHGPDRNRLMNTLMSFGTQADYIWLYDNNSQKEDLTDNGKFFGLSQTNEPCYYFSCDSDLYYPDDYVEKTIEQIEIYGCIVSYHGRKLRGPGLDYYHEHYGYPFNKELKKDVLIDVAGTGVTAFRTDYFNPKNIAFSEYKRMSDLVFSLEAAKQSKRIICLAHTKDWILQQEVPKEETIMWTEKNNCFIQNKLADEIWEYKKNITGY